MPIAAEGSRIFTATVDSMKENQVVIDTGQGYGIELICDHFLEEVTPNAKIDVTFGINEDFKCRLYAESFIVKP